MHEHIELMMAAVSAKLRRERHRTPRRSGPRRARGTFVPVVPETPALGLAH